MTKLSTQEQLEWLEDFLGEHRTEDWAALQPGLTDVQVAELETALDSVKLPEAFQIFYQWHNGQHKEYFLDTHYSWYSAASIIEEWQSMKDMALSGGWLTTGRWNLQWIPFGTDYSCNLLCLDMAGSFGGPAGQVFKWIHDDSVWPILNSSLAKWIECICAGLSTGFFEKRKSAAEKALSLSEIAKYSSVERNKHLLDLMTIDAEWDDLVWGIDPGYKRFTDKEGNEADETV